MPTAKDIMSKDVICVPTDMDLRDLAKLFLARAITGAPVVDAEGNLAGVISQTDLLYYHLTRDDELVLDSDFYATVRVDGRPVASGFQVEDLNTGRVEDAMTPVVHSVLESTDLRSIAKIMTRKHIHRVIVRRGRRVVGIISALDLLRSISGGKPLRSASRPRAARPALSRKARRSVA